MSATTIVRAAACVLVVAGTSILAAPEQTARPGEMTKAEVWVKNRGRAEMVPVDLREVNLDAPLKVTVTNGDPAFARTSPVSVQPVRPLWEYQTITITAAENLAARLNVMGPNGWETTGIWSVNTDGVTTVLLKRPR